MKQIKKNQYPEIVYVLPELSISGGIAVALRHVYELRKAGREAIVLCLNTHNDGSWFPFMDHIPVYSMDHYMEKFNDKGVECMTATWWETAFPVSQLNARKKYYFLQSLENRFYEDGNANQDAFFLTFYLGLNIFTEAKWIQKWLKESLRIDAQYVPNGLDTSLFYPSEKQSPPLNGKLRVLIEGPANVPFKGVNDCFEAVKDLDVEIWYITMDKFIRREWKIDKLFHAVPYDSMRDIYNECDVLLKMSKVEGVFGPPLEMMACGGTCVVGDVTGYDEYCVNEKNCLVVDKNQPDQARHALLRLINDRKFLDKLKAEGLKTSQKYSWKQSADILNRKVFAKTFKRQNPDCTSLNSYIANIKKHLQEYEIYKSMYREKQAEIELIHDSVSWKLGRGLTFPIRKIRDLIRKNG